MTITSPRNGLAVYGTDGEMYYPDPVNGNGHPEVNEWFLSSGLRFYIDTGTSELMAYLGDVRHPREKDQAFAVYEGGDASRLLSECQRSVRDGLLEDEGWQIIEVSSPSDQKSLYHELLGERASQNDADSRPLSRHAEFEPELLDRSLRATNARTAAEPIEVIASDFRVAANLVYAYCDVTPVRIHIYDNQHVRPPRDVDLAIKVEPGPYTVKVPHSTRELLESLQRRLDEHRAKERTDATVEAIGDHARYDDRRAVVRDAVESGFEQHYGSLEVIEAGTRERLESELRAAETDLEETRRRLNEVESELQFRRSENARLQKYVKTAGVVEKARGAFASVGGLVGRSGTDYDRASAANRRNRRGGVDRNDAAFADDSPTRDGPGVVGDGSPSIENAYQGSKAAGGLPWKKIVGLLLILAVTAVVVAELTSFFDGSVESFVRGFIPQIFATGTAALSPAIPSLAPETARRRVRGWR